MDLFGKCVWVVPLKDKKGFTMLKKPLKVLDNSMQKPNKKWTNKGSKFYNRPRKSWLQDKDIDIYSTHKQRKSVASKRFIRTLKNKINKY